MELIKKNSFTVLLVVLALIGAMLVVYPSFANWWNSLHQSRAIASYMDSVTSLDSERYDEIIQRAQAYNAELSKTGMILTMDQAQEEDYLSQLNIDESGIMGYITVPKIDVMLPIYHGTDDAVLQVAIGHLVGTSLPVGGEGSHCVVSGHRGLPSARLFTDLDKLVEGDTFTLSVLDRTLTYEVDQIRIVEPYDLSDLQIEAGKDYCTLVTCTPYGINTHRLLVRGHRIANAQGEGKVVADALQIKPVYIVPFVAAPILLLLLVLILIDGSRRRKHRRASMLAREQFGASGG